MERLSVSLSTNHSSTIQVYGFSCRSCSDVGYANKGIDPAHPKSGAYDVNAATDPSRKTDAVRLSGRLAGLDISSGAADRCVAATGTQLNVCA